MDATADNHQPLGDLAELQTQFAEAMHYRTHQLSDAIRDETFSSEQRLQIYRNNFVLSLSEILTLVYPTVQSVVGEECFMQLARQHVLNVPLNQGDVSDYGEGFHRTIQGLTQVHDAVPYLSDLAELEWAIDRVRHHDSAHPSFPLHKLSELTPDRLAKMHLQVPEPTYVFDSRYAIVSLWQMVQADTFSELDINQPESAIVQCQHEQLQVLNTTPAAIALVRMSQQQLSLQHGNEPMLAQLGELIQRAVFIDIF